MALGALCFMLPNAAWAATYSGNCGADGDGSNLTWNLNTDTGELIISGNGAMKDYDADITSANAAPWLSHRDNIQSVTVESGVTHIGNDAFRDCIVQATSVSLPEGLISIGDRAFFDWPKLESITLPTTLESIGAAAFNQCKGLTSIEIPSSVSSIGQSFFRDSTNLTTVTFAEGSALTILPTNAFQNCTALTSVTLPESLNDIGYSAFQNSGLTSITLPSSITKIGNSAFYQCASLQELTIPGGVTILEAYLCRDCTSLTTLVIPHSVTTIYTDICGNCSSNLNIYYYGTQAEWNNITKNPQTSTAFDNVCCSTAEITVEEASGYTLTLTSDTSFDDDLVGMAYYTQYIKLDSGKVPNQAWFVDGDNKKLLIGFENPWPSGSQLTLAPECFAAPNELTPTGFFQACTLTLPDTAEPAPAEYGLSLVCQEPSGVQISGYSSINVFDNDGQIGTLTDGSALPVAAGMEVSVEIPQLINYTPGYYRSPEDESIQNTINSAETYIKFTMPARDFTLKIIYNPKPVAPVLEKYTLKIDYKYENGDPAGESYLAQINAGEEYEITSPLIDGYTADLPTVSGTLNKNTQVTVIYRPHLSITYHANNGSDEQLAQSLNSPGPAAATLAACSFTPPAGHQFDGWNTQADGQGSQYQPGSQLTLSEDLNLYAQWAEYQLRLSYTRPDGTTAELIAAYTVNGDNFEAEIAGIDGYRPVLAEGSAAFQITAAGDSYLLSGALPTADLTVKIYYEKITEPPRPNTGGSSGGNSHRNPPAASSPTEFLPTGGVKQTDLGTSPIQNAVRSEQNGQEYVHWIERLETPDYAQSFYGAMAGLEAGEALAERLKDDAVGSVFADESIFSLSGTAGEPSGWTVEQVEIVDFNLIDPYASGQTEIDSIIFRDEQFYKLPADENDQQINFGSLRAGDVVRTPKFNGIYITSLPKNEDFDNAKKGACEYIAAVFQAFDRDCPEIFWLNGQCKVRIISATDPQNSNKTAYFFLVVADADGFSMRSSAWTAPGSVESGIERRDKAVKQILAGVTAEDAVGKLKQLNQWITEHNQYNTSDNLLAIDNEPHECLSALEGRIANQGPVCDGYSRALKVLCDQLGIACVLETGWARPSGECQGEFHMWNNVQVNANWYGVDVTWNDPSVKGFVGAKSGRENENFLLVGTDTVVKGTAFSQSHVVKNQAAAGGVDFNNGPVLSHIALADIPFSSGLEADLFDDLPAAHWAAEAAAWARTQGYMQGTGPAFFGPEEVLTRQQLWTVLMRLSGQNPTNQAELLRWLTENELSDGSDPQKPADRQQTVTLLWRWARQNGQNTAAEELSGWVDAEQAAPWAKEALAWATASGIIKGVEPKELQPEQAISRAQFVVILQRFCQNMANKS